MSIRLKNYDYAQPGAYFITIDLKNRERHFTNYPGLKRIIKEEWGNIPERYPNVKLGVHVIMPDHFHGIIVIVGATLAVAKGKNRVGARPTPTGIKTKPTLGDIVGSFKSLCFYRWFKYIRKNKINAPVKFWQRNYYEHVIRNEREFRILQEYILKNPLKHRFPD